jgi:hypothetical protein
MHQVSLVFTAVQLYMNREEVYFVCTIYNLFVNYILRKIKSHNRIVSKLLLWLLSLLKRTKFHIFTYKIDNFLENYSPLWAPRCAAEPEEEYVGISFMHITSMFCWRLKPGPHACLGSTHY